jgi:ABC-2 type transport system permease protein
MNRILEIARREYNETVKTKTFLMSVLMTPLLVVVMVLVGKVNTTDMQSGARPPKTVVISDHTGNLADDIQAAFAAYNQGNPRRPILLRQLLRDQDAAAEEETKDEIRHARLDALVIVDKDAVGGSGSITFCTGAARPGDLDFIPAVKGLLNRVVVNQRCRQQNIAPELLAQVNRPVPMQEIDLGAAAREERRQNPSSTITAMMIPFFFMFMIFMGIFGMGQQMLTSIIEEKSSRVMEVLLAAVSPFQLMAGKILGLAGIGLTVIGLWSAAAYGAAQWRGVHIDVRPELIAYFVIYYILGFVLFSAILAGIGSTCNTIKEAQSLMMPINLLFVLPLMMWFNLAQHPDGTLARVLSFVPPVTPMVMMLRLSASPHVPLVEILASIAVLAGAVPVAIWAAARVFRTGILMYGKRPSFRELLYWLKAG